MKEQEFQHNMVGAESFRRLAESPDVSYWEGYTRGLRRHYHGDKFGTPEEHNLWMALANEKDDTQRRFRGIGYRAGFNGVNISDAIKHIQLTIQKGEIDKKKTNLKLFKH